MAKRSNLKPASGTLREKRFPAALDPASAPVDERSCPELMAFALDFSRLLAFSGPNDQPNSDWYEFFSSDLSFLLARIATTDFRREYFESWALQNAVKGGQEKTREILRAIYAMAKRIHEWYVWAANIALKNRQDNQVRQTLQAIIQKDLSQYFGKHIDGILQRVPSPEGRETWSQYWVRRENQFNASVWRAAEGETLPVLPEQGEPVDQLLAILRALHQSNRKLHDVAQQYLDKFLELRSDHPPHIALYISFCKLLLPLRDKLNRIPDKHLDFYYRDVLKLKERGSTPDVAHVCFELAPQLKTYTLPAGTRLMAGKDANGEEIEYATDEQLFINQARVTSLKALYLVQDEPALTPEIPRRVTSILALPEANSEDGKGEPLKIPERGWPTFGVNEATRDDAEVSSLHAELGFMIASPTLLLQEGERNVIITIAFAGDGRLEAALQDYVEAATKVLDASPAIETLLADAFLVYVSGEKGWMPLPQASFRRHAVIGATLEIEFSRKPLDPALVANALLASGMEGGSQWPLFKLALNPYARIYAYPFFKELKMESIEIRASARGVQKLQLRNELGPLDPAQPFPIFGSTPTQGSSFLVNHRELNVKKVNQATLTVTWLNLPKPPESLETYYAGYGLGIRDDSFKIRVSVFGEERWQSPADGHDLLPMFARDYGRTRGLLPVTVIAAAMNEISLPMLERPAPAVLSETEPPRGAIRLELAEPAAGFGHQVFPGILTEAAIRSAKANKNGTPQPLPNPPLAPIVKLVTLDYEAGEKLVLTAPVPANQQTQFCSIYPFGSLRHQGRATGMFPSFQEQGHLYLGISGAGPRQPVTLLFEICDAAFSPVPHLRRHDHREASPIRWRYLSGREWKDIPAWLLLADSTMGLTQSGIVKLSLPEDISHESTLMPAGMCWVEAAAPEVAGVYWSRVVSLATQAVTATRVCDRQKDLTPAILPAYSINQLKQKVPQINSTQQPFPTSNGRSRENAAQFRTRVSERLRHKDRAIQRWDFESMVLDRFPEVGQVKCVGPNNSRHFPGSPQVEPGTVYVVVTPRLEATTDREPRLPQYALKKIEAYLRSHTSVFVKDIHVINPVYETLKIFAKVEFSPEGDAASYMDQLDTELSKHLQRWRSKPMKPMPIGSGQVKTYEISWCIQQQSYVKQLRSLRMLHTFQREEGYVSQWCSEEQWASASAPWAVLIPASQHSIVAVGPDYKEEIDPGIRNLTVGSDLVMGAPEREEERAREKKKEKGHDLRYYLVIPVHHHHGDGPR